MLFLIIYLFFKPLLQVVLLHVGVSSVLHFSLLYVSYTGINMNRLLLPFCIDVSQMKIKFL